MYQTITRRGSRRTPLVQILLTAAAVVGAGPFLVGRSSAEEPKADLYVSPQGNDAWSGRLAEPNAAKTDGPLATIATCPAGRSPVEEHSRPQRRRSSSPFAAGPTSSPSRCASGRRIQRHGASRRSSTRPTAGSGPCSAAA